MHLEIMSLMNVEIDYEKSSSKIKRMPRFWTNTGFSPPQPIQNAGNYFESHDLSLNLAIIGIV